MSSLESRIDKIKREGDEGYFGTERERDLTHALKILQELNAEVLGNNELAWQMLFSARKHLDEVLQQHRKGNEG